MSKTKVQLEFFIPTGSLSRINDAIEETRAVLTKHKGTEFFITYSGPFPDDTRGKTDDQQPDPRRDLGRAGRDEANARARDDFKEDPRPAEPAGAEDGADEPAEPKRKRGRPAGSGKRAAEAPGSPAGQPERDAEGPGRGEGNRGHEPRGTDEGTGQGRGEGEGRARGAGADRGAERRDPDAARVKPAADEWDDEPAAPPAGKAKGTKLTRDELEAHYAKEPDDVEWPDSLMPEGDLDRAAMGEILSQHYEQTGDRAKTLTVLKAATGEGTLANVHPDDYDKAARALLKDAARIKHGVKR